MLKPCVVFGVVVGIVSSTTAFSFSNNPASTDYVKESLNHLNKELVAQITALNTQISLEMSQVKHHIVTHHIGDIFQGGMIFFVDSSEQHGLMVSLMDLIPDGIEWRNGEGGDRITNANAQGLGSGEMNTRLIVAEQTIDQQEGKFAALLASNYQIASDGYSPCETTMTASSVCYGGWYLPSSYELMLVHANLKTAGLGQLADAPYWSSTEASTTDAWLIDFSSGHADVSEKSTPAHVRAIHTF